MKSFAQYIIELFDSGHIIPLRLRKASDEELHTTKAYKEYIKK